MRPPRLTDVVLPGDELRRDGLWLEPHDPEPIHSRRPAATGHEAVPEGLRRRVQDAARRSLHEGLAVRGARRRRNRP